MITLHGDDQQYKIHWVRYLEECNSSNMPSQPGIGFLVGVAAKLDSCTAVVTLPGGQKVVCGMPFKLKPKYKSPCDYLCIGHYMQVEDRNDGIRGSKQAPEPKPEPVKVVEYEKESDLPF